MRAAVLEEFDKYPIIRDVKMPEINSSNEIIIKVAGAGICRTDIHEMEGNLKERTKLPLILGHENTGYVYKVGSGINTIKIGDPVILFPYITCGKCEECRKGNDMFCTDNPYMPGIDANGGYAEYLKTNIRTVVKLPDIPLNELENMAPLADAGITVYHAIKKVKNLILPTSTCAIIGIGGLGHIAIQILKLFGAGRIIAIDISSEKLRLAEKYGADVSINISGKTQSEILEMLYKEKIDVVFDLVGDHGTTDLAIKIVKNQGTVVLVGYGGNFNVNSFDMIIREINIIGSLTGTYPEFLELINLYLNKKIFVESEIFKLNDVKLALERLKSGKINGRGIIIP